MILRNAIAFGKKIFSAMNYVKSIFINSVKTDLLNAILVIKSGLIRKEKCCMPYKLTDSVV